MEYKNPNPDQNLQYKITSISKEISSVADNISHVVRGKMEVIEDILIGLTANGHILLLDVPGVAKTLLARSLAKSIDTEFKRIQFTPDLLPTDITGVNIFNPKTREFEFQPGPVFTSILLADEINRASPKTQSALLEAMEERQVSVDNVQYKLSQLFFVIATQNPIEHAGTYPLPAAQLDRFLFRLSVGYPDQETEKVILNLHTRNINPLDEIQPVVNSDQIMAWQHTANQIYTAPVLDDYLVRLANMSRTLSPNGHGVSPRATIMLKKAARATALLLGRDYIIPDDIHRIIKSVFAHRLISSYKVGDAVVEEIMEKVTL